MARSPVFPGVKFIPSPRSQQVLTAETGFALPAPIALLQVMAIAFVTVQANAPLVSFAKQGFDAQLVVVVAFRSAIPSAAIALVDLDTIAVAKTPVLRKAQMIVEMVQRVRPTKNVH